MSQFKKGFTNVILIVVIAALVLVTGYFTLMNKPSSVPQTIPAKTDLIKVKLLNAVSGQAIVKTDVSIYSDNGIRCITTPCQTDGQSWTGQSDDNGFIFVPVKNINVVTTITAVGYKSGRDLNKDSQKIDSHDWLIKLNPDK